jgi:hypothetical protein
MAAGMPAVRPSTIKSQTAVRHDLFAFPILSLILLLLFTSYSG